MLAITFSNTINDMLEYKGNFLGKRILVYDDSERCLENTLINEYRKFDKIQLLRMFSDLSVDIFKGKKDTTTLSGVPVTVDFLNYCILTALRTSDGSKTDISLSEIAKILKLSLPWYNHEIHGNVNKDNIHESMIKIAYRQFTYQESMAVIARSLYIYNILWPSKYNSKLNINDAFQNTCGISYDKILIFGLSLTGRKESYFYAGEYKKEFKKIETIDLTDNDFDNFLNCTSMDTNAFTTYNGSLSNPVLKYPILKTDFYPEGINEPAYLILSKACLFNKLVYGLYYDLLEKYAGHDGINEFKTIYGNVFQEYIGVLLKEHFKKWQVISEIKYQKDKNEVDTVDWFLKRGKNLILIEVKQASIYLSAKNSGNIDVLKRDINQNIIKAVNQLKKTEDDILSREYKELEIFNNSKDFQKLIIIGDPLYYANFIVNSLFNDVLIKEKAHVMNINDFEALLSLQGKHETLFYLLKSKSENNDRLKDFTEFIFEKYGSCHNGNKFLLKEFEKFIKNLTHPTAKV